MLEKHGVKKRSRSNSGNSGSRPNSSSISNNACSNNACSSNKAWKEFGPSERDVKETDKILSEELLRLSFNERNNINEEIHGVRNVFPEHKEDPESQQLALLDMDREVESILEMDKQGLLFEQIPTNQELRLAFLRAELYDTHKAANRLVTYIRFLRSHCACNKGVAGCDCGCYGDRETGGRIVAHKWFTREEYAELKRGDVQLMPFRDQSGRRVLIPLSACFKIRTITRLKISMYLFAGASEDVESQKRGFVVMIWPGMGSSVTPSNSSLFDSLSARKFTAGLQSGMPVRIVCIHFGNSSSPLLKLARVFFIAMLQEHVRTRFNIITGTKTELNYKIMGFGIHPAMIPVNDSGTIKTRNHVQWLETHITIEIDPYGSVKNTASGGAYVDCPGINDVLFHRGKSCQYHPGNVAFRSMLESKKRQHLAANQTMKKEIAWDLMEEVERRNGRFLYWDKSGWWVEFDNRTEVRHKVATSLRDFNKQAKAASRRQNTHSSTSMFRSKKQKRELDSDSSSDCMICECPPAMNM